MSRKSNLNLGLKPKSCEYKTSALLMKPHCISHLTDHLHPSPEQPHSQIQTQHRCNYKDKANLTD